MGAYNIMVENHKDNVFQQREEAEAIRTKKHRNMDHGSDKQGLDQVHRSVHEGLLHREIQAEFKVAGVEIEQ
eukprot:11242555-Heterocapsa_arctica.AAC.1